MQKLNPTVLLTAALSFVLFMGSFHLNQSLDRYMLYTQGVSLIFIPAGVKLLAILVGRFPAIVGLFVGSIYASTHLWTDLQTTSLYIFAASSVMSYAITALGVMKLMGIRRDLTNLRHSHIVVLSLTASVLNGTVHNFVYLLEGVTELEAHWGNSVAMALGDFLGCFAVVSLFRAVVLLIKARVK